MSLELPPLPYDYDALAPFMSRETLEYHHDKHHLAYVNAGNTLLKDSPLSSVTIEQICVTAFAEKAAGLINNIGQHFNHIHFWQWMRPGGGGKSLPGRLQRHVDLELGGFDRLRADFVAAGLGQFGSGWCWLSIRDGRLAIMRTPGGENPLMHGSTPLLGCDVWEHSYYVDYRNLRQKYLETWFDNLINWDHVVRLYEATL
jgi:superoxide dismutase, Fe-Mn family